MKKRVLVALLATALTVSMMTGCGSKKTEDTSSTKTEETSEDSDQEAADKVAKLIDDIMYRKEQTSPMSSVRLQKKPGISLLMHRKNW